MHKTNIVLILLILLFNICLYDSVLKYSLTYIFVFIYSMMLLKIKFKYIVIISIILFSCIDCFRIILCLLYNVYKITKRDKNLYKNLAYNLFSDLNVKIRHNFELLPKTPSILLLNYPNDIFEYFINGIIPVDTCYIVAKIAKRYMNLFTDDENIIYVNTKQKNNFQQISDEIQEKIKNRHILSYVESTKRNINGLGRIKKGMFIIAKNNNIPITPICVGKIKHFYGITKKQTFNIKVGETFYVKNILLSKNKVKNFFKTNLQT